MSLFVNSCTNFDVFVYKAKNVNLKTNIIDSGDMCVKKTI